MGRPVGDALSGARAKADYIRTIHRSHLERLTASKKLTRQNCRSTSGVGLINIREIVRQKNPGNRTTDMTQPSGPSCRPAAASPRSARIADDFFFLAATGCSPPNLISGVTLALDFASPARAPDGPRCSRWPLLCSGLPPPPPHRDPISPQLEPAFRSSSHLGKRYSSIRS
jgi:hypothetical protein